MRSLAVAALFVALSAAGCSYQLQGKVIEGSTPGILVVSKDDPRLNQPGLPAALEVMLDPNTMSQKYLGRHSTDLDGNFSISVNEVGAGTFEYELHLVSQAPGFEATVHQMRLPGKDRRIIVVMREGIDSYRNPRNEIDEMFRQNR